MSVWIALKNAILPGNGHGGIDDGFYSGKKSVCAGKSDIRGQIVPLENTSILVRMIGKSVLDFLFAMAARFGYGSDRGNVAALPPITALTTRPAVFILSQVS